MTCCVGFVDEERGSTLISADSAGASGLSVDVRRDPKIFRNGAFVIAFTSSFRMGQLLQVAALPEPTGADPFAFMVAEFIPAVRKILAEGGFRSRKDEVETGGTFLVAWGANLFVVMDDFQVCQSSSPHTAVGCGWGLALGALGGTEGLGLTVEDRVMRAMHQAERYSGGVRGPFRVIWTEAREASTPHAAGIADLSAPAPPWKRWEDEIDLQIDALLAMGAKRENLRLEVSADVWSAMTRPFGEVAVSYDPGPLRNYCGIRASIPDGKGTGYVMVLEEMTP